MEISEAISDAINEIKVKICDTMYNKKDCVDKVDMAALHTVLFAADKHMKEIKCAIENIQETCHSAANLFNSHYVDGVSVQDLAVIVDAAYEYLISSLIR